MSETPKFCWEVTVDGPGMSPSKRVRLKEHVSVGRDEDSDISFSDSMVSRRHASFQQRDGSLYIADLGSTNGTYVNDVRIQGERVLRDGDVVSLGGASLVCHEAKLDDESQDDVAHGVVKSTYKRSLTSRNIRKMVDVGEMVHADRSLGVVCQATNTLVGHLPLPEIFDKILEAILEAIPAQRAALMLLEGRPAVPSLKATRMRNGVEMGDIRQDIVQRVLEMGQAFLVRDGLDEPAEEESPPSNSDPIRSVMCAPLWSTSSNKGMGRVLGLIYLDNLSDRPPLADRDLHVLIMLANIAATKIENARLVEESLQQQRIEEDMRLAAAIQADLLPRSAPVVPGYSVCGKTEPCRPVGGDYFDFDHDGRTLHFALADVSGKGTGAAMLMVALRATVRAHWRDGALTQATARINRTFHQTVPPDKYATFFVARLDTMTGRLEYVNAGHNRPLLIGADGQWQRLEVGGTIIGAFPDATYEQESVVLEPGACLLVFSDGISDAWHNQEDADHHLVKLALERRPSEVTALRSTIFESVEPANDDRTLIIVERLAETMTETPSPPSAARRR
jgi:sigma-B regulation protein RsbU (phosphoserine phosphatase)